MSTITSWGQCSSFFYSRVASDLSAFDTSRYTLKVATASSSPSLRFQVGQPIHVSWTAPSNHSRKDWIGLYRLGSNRSQLVTRTSSLGKWLPIYQDEWDGDKYVVPDGKVKQEDAGEVVFSGEYLPWAEGQYELRYHHDGKHNVMSRLAPLEIYGEYTHDCHDLKTYTESLLSVDRPADPTSLKEVHSCLLNIVALSLDSDPALLPRSAKTIRPTPGSPTLPIDPDLTPSALEPNENFPPDISDPLPDSPVPSSPVEDDGRNPDDFTIMDEKQAKRIVSLCEAAFGVEITVDVVVADANVGALARRIVGARSLMGRSEKITA